MNTNLFLSDLHVGSTVSLCKPVTELDDGGSYHASRGQRWLYDNWLILLERIEKEKASGPVYTFIAGDALEADVKDRSKQLITRNAATVRRMAAEILEPLAKLSTALFFLRGTSAHVGKSAELEEELAADLGGTKCPEANTYSWWSMRWECAGIRFDVAHHPPGNGGGRPMNRYSMIDRLAADTLFGYANNKEIVPDIVIRGHVHRYNDSYNHFRVRAITLPAWTLATEYIHRIAPGALAEIGAVIIRCENSAYEVEPVIFTPARAACFTAGDIKDE